MEQVYLVRYAHDGKTYAMKVSARLPPSELLSSQRWCYRSFLLAASVVSTQKLLSSLRAATLPEMMCSQRYCCPSFLLAALVVICYTEAASFHLSHRDYVLRTAIRFRILDLAMMH